MDRAAGRSVELEAAATAFDLSTSGTGATWHVAGVARLGAGLAVRASQGRSMGAPSIGSLFGVGTDSFPAVTDPCTTSFGPRSPNVEINCNADGLSDGFVDNRSQLRARQGGNPALRPETADIRSAGVVFAPEAAAGVVVSADYFEIAVSDQANYLGASQILQSCYDSDPDQRSNCDRVVRDPATGLIELIDDALGNRGGTETAGVDVQLGYDSNSSIGRLRYHVGGTWLRKFETVFPDDSVRVGLGAYDLGVNPEYKLDGSLLWDSGMFGAGAHIRYVGGFTECEDNDCGIGRDDGYEPISREIDSYLTADVLGSLTLGTGLGQTMVTVGVRNLLDRQPPVVHNGFTASSDPATYDFTGRFAYLRLTQQF
jgi:outer membrane receptor protein involved in Fe transport